MDRPASVLPVDWEGLASASVPPGNPVEALVGAGLRRLALAALALRESRAF